MTQPTAQDLLMGGGGRMFSWALKQPDGRFVDKPFGTTVTGVIDGELSTAQQTDINTGALQTWPDGKPKLQVIIPLQTQLREDPDDDGKRTLWVKQSSNLQAAIRDATKLAGVGNLELGGVLTVTFVGTKPASGPGKNPIKVFTAQYQAPAQGVLQAPDGVQGQPQQGYPAQQAPQQFAQAPAAQPQPTQAHPAQQFQGQPQQGYVQPQQAPQGAVQAQPAPQYAPGPQAAPAPQQAPPVAGAAAPPDKTALIGQLLSLGTMTHEQIAAAAGVTLEQVKSMAPPY